MNIYTLKLTLSRSNPQMIRELRIKDTRAVSELLDSVCCLFDQIPDSSCLQMALNNRIISGNELLNSCLHAGDFATITGNTDSGIRLIHLEVISLQKEADNKLSIPGVSRLRTSKAPSDHYFSHLGTKTSEDYTQTLNRLNQKLRRRFDPDSMPPELHREIGIPLKRLLESRTVADLRNFAYDNDLYLDYGQRKADLIDDLCHEMDSDSFWESVLNSLNLEEYRVFRHLCFTGVLPDHKEYYWTVLPTLSMRFLVSSDRSGVVRIAEPLLDFFEQWIEDKNEHLYLTERTYQTILYACCRLYGFVDEKLADELMKACYPELYTKELASSLWTSEPPRMKEHLKKLNVSSYFRPEEIDRDSVQQLRQVHDLRGRLHYVPDRAMLEQVAEYGYSLEEPAEGELRQLLQQKFHCSYFQLEDIMWQIACACYYAMAPNDILNFCRDALNLQQNDTKLKLLSNFFKKYDRSFRRLPLFGFTTDEFEKFTSRKGRKS